jgi:hypothetical protein
MSAIYSPLSSQSVVCFVKVAENIIREDRRRNGYIAFFRWAIPASFPPRQIVPNVVIP